MIIESCNNYIIHKVTQILIIMHYLSKISMQTGQCMYKKQKVLGFGLPADKVYGLRFVDGAKLIALFDPQYKQPIKEGKVDCIKAYMAPTYGNTGPVLVAGDSNGDVAMLTTFPDMKNGLIIDVGRSETSAIGQLATQAKKEGNTGIYILQPSFEATED